MKIALVSPGYVPRVGGVEAHVAALATRMAARGHDVEVLTQVADRSRASTETIDGVVVRRFRVPVPTTNYAVAPGLWTFLRQARGYRVVHAHSYHSTASLAAVMQRPAPLVFTPHYHGTGHTPLRRALHPIYRIAGRRLVARAGAIICVSQSEASLLAASFPTAAPRTTVIPNGVEVDLIRAAAPLEVPGTVVLNVGRLERYKHVDRLVAAMPYLDETFTIVVVGDGGDRRRVEAEVTRLDLDSRVRMLGRIDIAELRRWLRTAGVVATMSSQEAFGMTLLEGLAAGAGVVASDIPAHREVATMVGEDTITLVDPSASPATLAAAIARAASTPAPLSAAVPSWDDITSATLAVYERVLG